MSGRNGKPTALVAPLQPWALSHYGGRFFKGTLPCESCGAASVSHVEPADEYDLTLQREAARLAYHARAEINRGHADFAAGMLRDAARLLDLLGQRQGVRSDAELARRPRRKAAKS